MSCLTNIAESTFSQQLPLRGLALKAVPCQQYRPYFQFFPFNQIAHILDKRKNDRASQTKNIW